ncbi:MAG: DUF547 domain-containing protein [Pseudomonadales bacterium]|nr:DUF547 domain-containing protein [Pseudomonadales bacterium]
MKKWVLSALALLLMLQNQWVVAAPKSDLWDVWLAHDKNSSAIIDHSLWDAFLNSYLVSSDGVNLVNYRAVTKSDKALLDKYLSNLQQTPISTFSRSEQFAYWVNLYNAATVQLILDKYPIDSIKDISFGWFSFGPWDEKLLKVESREVSLNDIEHRILRPIWKDNRIHYAVNCASYSCPNLAAQAYTALNFQQLLDQGAKDYVNHPRGVSLKGGELELSEIYNWYQVDFGDSETGVLEHLLKYANPELKKALSSQQKLKIDYDYDWRLNQSP